MIHLILVAPPVLSSKESQTNDIVLDKVIKTASDSLRIHLFGASVDIQKYIPSLYTTLWDYCLLYRKPSLDCIVIPQEGESSGSLLEASLSSVFVPDVLPNDLVLKVNEERRGKGLPVMECTPIPTPRWSDSIAPLDWESSRVLHFKTVCVDIEGIVVSLETLTGGELINQKRAEKGMKPLTILTVNRSSKYNLSSTFIREM
ncbi:hypothetical protein AV274_3186 [Blastocystis sp. ATCC 50177/Nand II]|uniref:Uncharacterized protein n=1 Tax=Blastocystis sp. subtype 1 (strain ATCC 50177 / NandII) TaxID=478820 RepID=A0A196SFK4_BLAHN|nr:hypothetical protein AV274_3186 [Blastocystis sp. ATCC 50177/Nand II]